MSLFALVLVVDGWACGGGFDGVTVEVFPEGADPADLLGVMVMVVPLFAGPPDALLMVNSGGEGPVEGDEGLLTCSGVDKEFSVGWTVRALTVKDLSC